MRLWSVRIQTFLAKPDISILSEKLLAAAEATAGTTPDSRWRVHDYEELIARDKPSLDIFWLKDESLMDSENLPRPAEIARDIIEDLEAALAQFRLIEADLAEPKEQVVAVPMRGSAC